MSGSLTRYVVEADGLTVPDDARRLAASVQEVPGVFDAEASVDRGAVQFVADDERAVADVEWVVSDLRLGTAQASNPSRGYGRG